MAIRTYLLPQKNYNMDKLDEDLKSALGASKFQGLNASGKGCWALLTELATAQDEATCTQYATNHVSTQLSTKQIQEAERKAMLDSALADFGLSALKGKTAAQIATYIQGEIDAWASLADARVDLREWLPLMAKALVYLLRREGNL